VEAVGMVVVVEMETEVVGMVVVVMVEMEVEVVGMVEVVGVVAVEGGKA
jgi:hypothetical protein